MQEVGRGEGVSGGGRGEAVGSVSEAAVVVVIATTEEELCPAEALGGKEGEGGGGCVAVMAAGWLGVGSGCCMSDTLLSGVVTGGEVASS